MKSHFDTVNKDLETRYFSGGESNKAEGDVMMKDMVIPDYYKYQTTRKRTKYGPVRLPWYYAIELYRQGLIFLNVSVPCLFMINKKR